MQIVSVEARKGRRKRDIVVVAIGPDDMKAMKDADSVMQGEFRKGHVYICHEEKLDDFLEILKGVT